MRLDGKLVGGQGHLVTWTLAQIAALKVGEISKGLRIVF